MKVKTQEIKKSILKNLKLIQQEVEAENNIPRDSEGEESDDDDQSLDSDQELQLAFARKELTPGLNISLPPSKEFVYDKVFLQKLQSIYVLITKFKRKDLIENTKICI